MRFIERTLKKLGRSSETIVSNSLFVRSALRNDQIRTHPSTVVSDPMCPF
jgi:hypothetical protein